MKTLILALLLIGTVQAGELEVNTKILSGDKSSGLYIESWNGIEFKYQQDESSLYYFASYDEGVATILAPVFDMSIVGVGFGFKKPATKNINFYGQVGYYMPKTSMSGRVKCEFPACGEGLYYGLNNIWSGLHNGGLVHFDEFEIEAKNGLGITFGTELSHEITKDLVMVLGIEYRALAITTNVHAMSPALGDYDVTGARWETVFKGLDSTNYKIGVKYTF